MPCQKLEVEPTGIAADLHAVGEWLRELIDIYEPDHATDIDETDQCVAVRIDARLCSDQCGRRACDLIGCAGARLAEIDAAAAPDLLAALQELLFCARHGNGLEAHHKAQERAAAAIAKATA